MPPAPADYRAVFDAMGREPEWYDRDSFLETSPASRRILRSPGFQKRLLENFFNAYPEKDRLIFIHVPKCAGSDLRNNLSTRYPMLHSSWYLPSTSQEEMLRNVHRAAARVHESDMICLTGHIPLREVARRGLIRAQDHVVTVVRDPIDLVISAVNFNLTRINAAMKSGDGWRPSWKREFGISQEAMPDLHDPELQRRMLLSTRTNRSDALSRYLGNGTGRAAIRSLIEHNVEITDVSRYSRWLKNRWNFQTDRRSNQSIKFISRSALEPDLLKSIEAATAESRIVFDRVAEQLERAGTDSIRGQELATAVAARLPRRAA